MRELVTEELPEVSGGRLHWSIKGIVINGAYDAIKAVWGSRVSSGGLDADSPYNDPPGGYHAA